MRAAVIGCGHMGGFLAQRIAEKHTVACFDINRVQLDRLKNVSFLESISGLTEFSPEILINAVPLTHTIDAFKKITHLLKDNCIIADVASVKGQLPEFYKTVPNPFVSVHPMFGPTFADIKKLRGESCVFITESDRNGLQFFQEIFKNIGLTVFEYSFEEHDKMMAYSLTMPFVSTMVFAACLDKKVVPGTTFAKHKEIADGLLSEDDQLLAEILFNGSSLKQLEKVTGRLEFLKHVIKARDFEEAKIFFRSLRKNIENGKKH